MNPTQKDIEMMKELGMIPEEESNEHQIEEVRNDKAFISNDIINALFQSSTITAFKIMFYLSRVDSKVERGDQLKITLNLKDFLDYTSLRKETLDDNIKRLQQTLVTFYDKSDKKYFTRVQMIGKADYSEDNKNLLVWIDKDIYKRLKETQKSHTEFNTADIMKLTKHKHSIRILMLITYINGFTTEKSKRYTLKQLNFMFDTDYSNYSEFCRKVLDKAQSELSDNGLMTFDYVRALDKTYLGKGRKPISHITIVPVTSDYTEPNIYAFIEQSKHSKISNSELSPKTPTDEDINYAINELGVTSNEAEQKYSMFLEWEKSIGKKRRFQKYLLDGKMNNY